MAWAIHERNGIWLPDIGWWLDARRRTVRSFVSHAHSDHIARHAEVVCSPPTARLLRARLPGRRRETILEFGRPSELMPGLVGTLHPAGHILGSSQILLESREGSLLYTGDFRLRPGGAAEACATPRAEVLIMETTFGLPRYTFPPEAEIIAGILGFCRESLAEGRTPVLLCYSLGKTQEVLAALAPGGLPVMLHPQAHLLTEIYRELGVALPPARPFDPRDLPGHVVICPPHAATLLRRVPEPRTAAITGWAIDAATRFRFRCDAAFPLSDHAGYDDLLRFVEGVRPRRIFTVHGFAREFAATLRSRGWDALALGRDNQLDLPLGAIDEATAVN